MAHLTRRQLVSSVAGRSGRVLDAAQPPVRPEIHLREEWGSDRQPRGPLPAEEVRFLIVHHSASWNGHRSRDVPDILRRIFDFHTGPERGWSDIAYNFLIDADGGIWEGRAGSLAGPVAGDATGGNQGFSQLVCLIGDFQETEPSDASRGSLVHLLGWLATVYEIPTGPGAEVAFVSRGSNLHPEGTPVTTPTITGHRTMSRTSCPGDHLDSYVTGALMADVTAARFPTPSTTLLEPPTSTTTTSATTTSAPVTSTSPASPVTSIEAPATSTQPMAETAGDPPGGPPPLLVPAVAGIALGAAALAIWRHRRMTGR